MKYTCVNAAYTDFINKYIREIDFVAPVEKVRVKVNSKPWIDSEIILALQKRDKLFSIYNKSGLETGKDNFKTARIFCQKMLHKKKDLI